MVAWVTEETMPELGESRGFLRGAGAMLIAVAVVAVLLIMLPAYRWFFLISIAIGLMVAGILYLWNRYKPVKEEDVHGKRPLGL